MVRPEEEVRVGRFVLLDAISMHPSDMQDALVSAKRSHANLMFFRPEPLHMMLFAIGLGTIAIENRKKTTHFEESPMP
jgi:hypothetical protein